MKTKPLSITLYTALFIGIFLLVLGILGCLTYQEVVRLEEEFHNASQMKAAGEIDQALTAVTKDIERHTREYAAWEEVHQQLQNPVFYAYWYRHRAINRNMLPEYVADIAVYDKDGKVLAETDATQLPQRIDRSKMTSHLLVKDGVPRIFSVEPVIDPLDHRPLGFIAMLSDFYPEFFHLGRFNHINQKSFLFNFKANERVTWAELPAKIQYLLLSDPLAEAMKEVMAQSVIRLAVILGFFTLLIFPVAAWLIGKPICLISDHIDILRRHSSQPIPDSFERSLPIKELDKVRKSLNDYHRQLNEVNFSLDEKNKELWELAHHDPLTGVGNRRAFDDYCREIRNVFLNSRQHICLALLDVNHFKAINDSYGHQIGDQVLIAISQSIRMVLREGEQLFRLGGDEFAAVLIDCSPKEAQQIAERCQQAITAHPFTQLGIKEPIRISIGLAHASADTPGSLLSLQWQADVAMYSAKRPGQSHIAHFTQEMAEGTQGLFSNWANSAVYEAIIHGTGLVMYYQPIVNLDDGLIQYFEALARIIHEGDMIMPSHIFPLVEARKLELDLDRRIIQKIAIDLKTRVIPPGTGISINLSAPALINAEIIQQLASLKPLMKDYRMVLEITETALITQIQIATKNLAQLQWMGFEIALDDFGSGYSSLRYLAQMPVDIVKFDISLTHLINDLSQLPILKNLTKMIDEAGYQLVAEGIESEELADKLRKLGFQWGQGSYFGEPKIPERLTA